MDTFLRALLLTSALLPTLPVARAAATAIPVTTYHYDDERSGWNRSEQVLAGSNFPATFGVLHTVALDDEVDAQPLLVPAENIAGGTHDVVYVVTENNSVYGIDANSGAVLLQRNLGTPSLPVSGCTVNGPHVGIMGTPVIDLAKGEIFLIASVAGASPTYQLHALDLTTLADAVAPVTVAATQTLTDGTTFVFNAANQHQRPGLLELNGVIYAGFGSYCDFNASVSRGWVLGFKADTLAPLANAKLNDTQATSPTNWFLSSVWMSGFGIAGAANHVFFTTGNSDCDINVQPEKCPSKSSYDGVTNIQESVVSMASTLASQDGIFTPGNVFTMDKGDQDLSAGGVMLIPKPIAGLDLAAVAGKDGRLFLLDRNDLSTALNMQQLADGCWCGPSYFQGSDGIARIVSSAGNALQTWQIQTSPAPHLVAEATAHVQQSDQDPGFFTVVSSNADRLASAILWAVARPSATAPVTLYAFAAAAQGGTFKRLYSAPAGQWPNAGNANIVPVVANGKVYVASYQTLMIFGPNAPAVPAAARPVGSIGSIQAADSLPPGASQRVTGRLLNIEGMTLTLSTRRGRTVTVDVSEAVGNEKAAVLVVGQPYTAVGAESAGTLRASSVTRAKRGTASWPTDTGSL